MARRTIQLVLLLTLATFATACSDRTISVRHDSGFQTRDIATGNGLIVDEGSVITVRYTVKLPDGTTVIDTDALGRTHTFIVGGGTVVLGMDKLVRGMRAGGIREGRIPPALHYGSQGYGDKVPPNTTLTFRVEVISVRTG